MTGVDMKMSTHSKQQGNKWQTIWTSWSFWSCWHATNFPAHYLKIWSTKFLGDSYFKSFPAVEGIYEGVKAEKRECISLVQKRVEVMLKNPKKNVKELGRRGHLTDKIIDKLQNCYGMGIRQNSGDLNAMKSTISASLFHVTLSGANNFCSYCTAWSDNSKQIKVNNTSTYKPGPGLPMDVIKS